MCLLQGNRSWYASATDHVGTWRWPAFAVYFHRCSSWTRLLTCPLRPTPGVWVVSAKNYGIRSCSADTGVDVPVVQVVDWVSCWRRVPTVQTLQKTGEIPQVLSLDTVVTPVVVQRQVLGLRQYRKLVDVPVCAVHRRLWTSLCLCSDVGSLAGGASDSVHRQSWWTFQLQRQWASSIVLWWRCRVGHFSRSSGSSRS